MRIYTRTEKEKFKLSTGRMCLIRLTMKVWSSEVEVEMLKRLQRVEGLGS